jgi:hypothetical protein
MRTTSTTRMCIREVDIGTLLVVSLQPESGTYARNEYEVRRTRDLRRPGNAGPAAIVCGQVIY